MKTKLKTKQNRESRAAPRPASIPFVFVPEHNAGSPNLPPVRSYCNCCFGTFTLQSHLSILGTLVGTLLCCWHSFWSLALLQLFTSVVATVREGAVPWAFLHGLPGYQHGSRRGHHPHLLLGHAGNGYPKCFLKDLHYENTQRWVEVSNTHTNIKKNLLNQTAISVDSKRSVEYSLTPSLTVE